MANEIPDVPADVVTYVARWGGRCRDCADENGVCPYSGFPCGGDFKAIENIIAALRYGVQHGYIDNPITPADMVLVPREPTEAMLKAASGLTQKARIYRAMVAAAKGA